MIAQLTRVRPGHARGIPNLYRGRFRPGVDEARVHEFIKHLNPGLWIIRENCGRILAHIERLSDAPD